jgi:hypothetical protein
MNKLKRYLGLAATMMAATAFAPGYAKMEEVLKSDEDFGKKEEQLLDIVTSDLSIFHRGVKPQSPRTKAIIKRRKANKVARKSRRINRKRK